MEATYLISTISSPPSVAITNFVSCVSVRLTAQWRRTCPSATRGSWSRSLAGSCSWWCRETSSRCWSASPRWPTVTLSSMVRDNRKAAGPIPCKPAEWPSSTYISLLHISTAYLLHMNQLWKCCWCCCVCTCHQNCFSLHTIKVLITHQFLVLFKFIFFLVGGGGGY